MLKWLIFLAVLVNAKSKAVIWNTVEPPLSGHKPQVNQPINQSTLFNEFNTGQYFNWITSGPQTKIIKQKLSDKIHIVNEKEL